ncbi:MAG: hypothetical protein ACLU0O_05655 [Collinsella sp.]
MTGSRSTPMPEDVHSPLPARGRDPRAGYGDGGYSDRGYRGFFWSLAVAMRMPNYAGDAVFRFNHSRMASALRLRVWASVAIKAAVNCAPLGQRSLQGQGGYRGRSDSNRGRMPQEAAAAVPIVDAADHVSSKQRARPRIVYAGIGAVALLLIVLIVVLLRGCASRRPRPRPRRPLLPRRRPRSLLRRPKRSTRTKTPMRRRMSRLDSDATKTTAKKEENEVTKVKVSVAKGRPRGLRSRSTASRSMAPKRLAPLSRNTARVLDRDHHVQAFRCHRYQER